MLKNIVIVAPVYVNGTAIVREMARKGAHVVAVDTYPSALGFASRYPREKAVVPSLYDEPGSFARWLLARHDLYGALVVPTDDFFLRELYLHRETLQEHFTLAIAAGDAVEICLDKALTADAATAACVPIPRTRVIDDASELDDAADYVGFPAIIKPTFSISFARKFQAKVLRVDAPDDLREAFERCRDAGERVLLQEVIPGPDSNMAVHLGYYDRDGKCVGSFTVRKTLQYPPMFGVGQLVTVESLPEVDAVATKMLSHIGFAGSACSTEVKYDERDRTWKLIEINPRTPMQTALARPAGCDVVDMIYRGLLGMPQLPPRKIRQGLRWTYLKNATLRHALYPADRPRLREYLRLYRPPIVFALLSLTDLAPFAVDIWPLIRRRLPFPPKNSPDGQ